MNDQYGRSWPEEEPGQWDAPQWPGGDNRGGPRQPQRGSHEWPAGDEPQWPGGEQGGRGRPPRGGPAPGGAQGWPQEDRQPPPPRQQHGGGYRPPPPGQPPLPPRRQQPRQEEPTSFVPPTPEQPEPELITHHEHNGTGFAGDAYDDRRDSWPSDENQAAFNEYSADDDGDDGDGKKLLTPAQRKRRRWKRVRRAVYVLVGLFVVAPAAAFTVLYFTVDVPTPAEVAAKQDKVVTYLFADETELGKDIPQGGNREMLEPGDIPQNVRRAIYATEDSTFETNSGFDITGIMRAVYNQVTGGVGGGSTISQQYVKKATENEEGTLTRKATELVKSFKMNKQYNKDEIITAYLNTIYFGRGSYGIQTAAQSFFGKSAKDMTTSEAALLAGLIQQPGRSENRAVAEERWRVAMDRIVENNWMTPAERAQATFPEIRPLEEVRKQSIAGPNLLLKNRIVDELESKGITEDKIQSGGYKIYTTIDPKGQDLAIKTVNEVMEGQPQDLREALVAIDPKTGGVLAYYGGPNTKEDQRDWANTARPPGSSFKPFDLVALLKTGKGLGETYDGTSPRKIQNATVRNSEGVDCSAQCSVAEAMEKSVNTVFYDFVARQTGVEEVVDAAHQAGVKAPLEDADNNLSIGGGRGAEVTPAEMAAAYATFAADGMQRDAHFVSKVLNSRDEVVYEAEVAEKPAFAEDDPDKSKQIAGNVTKSLVPVLPYSKLACGGGYDCAGKTGTHQYTPKAGEPDSLGNENSQAWMVGYSPTVSTSAWVGTEADKVIRMANKKKIYGKDLPGEMWKKFMDAYLKGKPKEKFSEVKLIGRTVPTAPPSQPSKSQQPSQTPSSPAPSESTAPSDPPDGDPSGGPSDSDKPGIPGLPGGPGGHNGGDPLNGRDPDDN
ncbi:transglycosylase domain-containing protein [Amycolatopsis magusensis]|uniref:Membrane peptidoglycan carboxypeptidase n=1 Tax=Amycolatopsis magusensis TaxID=882444 RepID=A0ABS4PMG7_9PSEU|nr:transglycosylase domain-containing protein [Amycolatopsis magusensis]MBP2179816.1 membrane peptidoglycan carboxypeptidase [Amycolatopsis magusensis]